MGVPAAAVPVLWVLIAAFGLYMGWEIWRWVNGNRSLLTSGQFRRRLAGGILLLLDLLMWVVANPLMTGRPARERLLYLLVATGIVFVVMLLAVREASFVLRQYLRWKGSLLRSMAREEGSSSDGTPP